MRQPLILGLRSEASIVVDLERTIDLLGPDLRIYATPFLLRDVEAACGDLLRPFLRPDQSSVGTVLSVEHLSAALIGAQVRVQITVVSIDRRRIGFQFEVASSGDLLARGRHERFIIEIHPFRERLRAKYG